MVAPVRGAAPPESELLLREGLGIRTGGRFARSAFHTDPIEASMVAGTWTAPHAGDKVMLPNGTNTTWEPIVAREDGSFSNAVLRGGYVYLPYVSDTNRVLLLQAAGHTMVYVNGEPRTGDPYQNGSVSLPIQLRQGTNDMLFSVGRGALRVRLAPPAQPIFIDLRDNTLPDLIAGEKNVTQGAVLIVNTTTNLVRGLRLTVSRGGGSELSAPVPDLLPLSTRKVGFPLEHSGISSTNQVEFKLKLTRQTSSLAEPCDEAGITLRLRQPDELHQETFRSDLDGSVQYYAVTPARPLDRNRPPQALVLTAHGASVEARGQAAAYAPKTWAHIVAPTNRRPYGFDWEDWGRRDAMEVLALAQRKYGTDPHQTYLTGHSMGGHGTWQLGATYPDRFAAIAPSAGWISFFSYAGGRRYEGSDPLQQLIQRAATPSDTLALSSNYLHHGIYILHGDADDNVPVREARTMRGVLEKFHRDFTWHEQPGAGHWWGNACVDWPPLFDFFARRKLPDDESVRTLQFTTANPGVSSSSHWISIETQKQHLGASTVSAGWDPDGYRFTATTTNVARLAFSLAHVRPGRIPTVEIDGQAITNVHLPAGEGKIWFSRAAEVWAQIPSPSLTRKGPHRYGPFKEAFLHRMLFVYGTQGTPGENAWALAKARFDAEAFWYRGNGSVEVVADTDFDAGKERDRGVILYGHAESNSAWKPLLGDSPVEVYRGRVRIGGRDVTGDDLSCLFLRPRPGSDIASVGVISGTGLVGLKLTDRVPYFLAGVAFPDCTVFGLDALTNGAEGARVAGYFGEDWSVADGEFLWRNESRRASP